MRESPRPFSMIMRAAGLVVVGISLAACPPTPDPKRPKDGTAERRCAECINRCEQRGGANCTVECMNECRVK